MEDNFELIEIIKKMKSYFYKIEIKYYNQLNEAQIREILALYVREGVSISDMAEGKDENVSSLEDAILFYTAFRRKIMKLEDNFFTDISSTPLDQ